MLAADLGAELIVLSAAEAVRPTERTHARLQRLPTDGHLVIMVEHEDGDSALGPAVSRALSWLSAGHTADADVLVVTGGATARQVLSARRIAAPDVIGELEPGIVLLRSGRQHVITNAGSFGAANSLASAVRRLIPVSQPQGGPPVIGITMGDGAGVGPEGVVKTLAHPEIQRMCRAVVLGDGARLQHAVHICGVNLEVRLINSVDEARFEGSVIDVIQPYRLPVELGFGELAAAAGEGSFRYLEAAAKLAIQGRIQAICTAPLNKQALHLAGHIYPGHTEMLAAFCDAPEVSMMLTAGTLRVIHVTTHIGLLDAIELIDVGLVLRTIRRGYRTLVDAGIPAPRIAVCGINPHAGENGLFGRGEEDQKIVPAVQEAVADGIDAHGPLPADTVFFRAGRGDFDLVVAMYHDPGHGPVKVLGLEHGVNITVGLPVVRTSVDHGTAFDIAGNGKADARSMVEALRQAAGLATRRLG